MKAAILLCTLTVGALAQRRPWSPEDLWQWRTAEDARVRPDGKWVVWTERFADRQSGAEHSNLWIASTDGRERRQWTEGAWRDRSPRWSPDGERIAWISDRGESRRVHVRKWDGGPEIEIGGEFTPVALAWSAEGDRLAITGQPALRQRGPDWAPESLWPRLRMADPVPQIYLVAATGGTARQLSRAPSGCAGEAAWMLDGKALIAVCGDGMLSIATQEGTAKPLTKDAGRYESPVVSPDGGRIAYLFTDRKPQTYTVRKLWVMNADGSRPRTLSGSLDRDATAPQWSSESRTVYFVADDRGSTHVYAARNDGTVRQVTDKPERLAGFSLADNGRAASVRRSATEGGDVVTFTVDLATQPVTLAEPNGRLLAERDPGPVEEIGWESGGNRVQGWLIRPPKGDFSAKYPLLVDVSDDPRSMYGVEFSVRAQVLAARGLVVLCANPRGTPGYGEQFGHLLRTRYPGDDLDDLLRGVEAAAGKEFVDGGRVSIAGGLVAAWAIGHTARFAKAVARRPIVNWAADLARSGPMGAMPWDDPEQYVKRSPLFAAGNFRTPTLILAPEGDAQAELLYRALEARKVAAEWVRWKGEAPADRVAELEAVGAWLAARPIESRPGKQ